MSKKIVAVNSIPAAGPYSLAVEAGPFVFCSGQLPVDPRTGTVITADVRAATDQALQNIRTILAAAGLGLEQVVKTTVFLVDMGDFAAMNDVYGRYFPADPPARSTIQVAALPKGAPLEIEAIAVRPA